MLCPLVVFILVRRGGKFKKKKKVKKGICNTSASDKSALKRNEEKNFTSRKVISSIKSQRRPMVR